MFERKPLASMAAEAGSEKRLRRVLGAAELTGLGIGAIVGAGIFVSTGAAARDIAGPALMLSFVVAGVTCVFVALCYAELASMTPVTGSAYTYAYATLGEFPAWIVGWILVLGYGVSAAVVAQGVSRYFQDLLGVFGLKLPAALTSAAMDYNPELGRLVATGKLLDLPAVLVTAIVTVILIVGIRESARFNALMVVVKLGVIMFVIGVGALYVHTEAWTPFAPYGLTGINLFGKTISGQHDAGGQPLGMLAGAAIAFFAYIGFDCVATYSEEARRPRRDVPAGIIASLSICTVLYIGVTAVLTGMAPYKTLDTQAPISSAFVQAGLPWARVLISTGALTGIVSVVLVSILTQTRILLAMARDGLIPGGLFGALHERFRTPWKATLFAGIFVAVTSSLLPIGVLIGLVSIGILLVYLIVCVGVMVMRRIQPEAERTFRVPFMPVVPLLGVASCLLLMLSLPFEHWLRLSVWLLLGLAIYFGYGRRNSALSLIPAATAAASLERE